MSTTEDTNSVPPVACTLSLGKRQEQLLEWSDLAPLALTRTEITNGVASTYPLALADRIEDLATRETSCCGTWLDIFYERTADDFKLALTTPNPDGVALIRDFSGLTS